jgi:hypothetical protein
VDLAFRRSREKTTLFSFIGLSHGDDVPGAAIQRRRFSLHNSLGFNRGT